MLGVFAEFECSIIQQCVRVGLQRAKCEAKRLGRLEDKLAERIRAALAPCRKVMGVPGQRSQAARKVARASS